MGVYKVRQYYFWMLIATGFCCKSQTNLLGVVTKISYLRDDFTPNFFLAKLTFLIIWALRPVPYDIHRHSRCICLANSRVGANIMARKPAFWGRLNCWMIGIRKAKVFPEPVGAQHIICRLANIRGMACIWMGVGLSKPDFPMFSLMIGSTSMSSNETIGSLISLPWTVILLRLRNRFIFSTLICIIFFLVIVFFLAFFFKLSSLLTKIASSGTSLVNWLVGSSIFAFGSFVVICK